jgi:hypothetical protein
MSTNVSKPGSITKRKKIQVAKWGAPKLPFFRENFEYCSFEIKITRDVEV